VARLSRVGHVEKILLRNNAFLTEKLTRWRKGQAAEHNALPVR